MRALIGIVVLAALAYFGFRLLQSEEAQQALQETTQQASSTAQSAAQQAQDAANRAAQAAGEAVRAAGQAAQETANLVIGGVDVGAELKGLVERASASLDSVTDQASAQAARPNLEEVQRQLDGLGAKVEQLPAEGRRLLASAVNAALPGLKEVANRVGSIQGAEGIKPTLDAMVAKLESWAKAPA